MVDILTETLPHVVDDYDALSFKNCLVFIYTDYTKGLPWSAHAPNVSADDFRLDNGNVFIEWDTYIITPSSIIP